MSLTLEQLLKPLSPKEALSLLLTALSEHEAAARVQGLRFPVTDWHSGGVVHTLLRMQAEGLADLSRLIPKVAAMGFLQYADGASLDELALSQYGLTRKPALYTYGLVTLSAEEGFGPYTIEPEQMWLGTPSGLRFLNVEGGVLPQGGSLSLMVRAESPGAAYNVPPGSISVLHTPLPGVTCTNPTDWINQAGVDQESDAGLRMRCQLRWAELGYGATRDAYEFWARSAHPAVTKVRVLDQHPRGQGTVDVVLWGEGGLAESDVAQVADYIQIRRPLTANVAVYAATARHIPVQATLRVRQGQGSLALAQALQRLGALQRELPIGAVVYRSALIEALYIRPYVVDVSLVEPQANIPLGEVEAAVFVPSLSLEE